MRTIPKIHIAGLCMALLFPIVASANSDIHFTPDGSITASGILVYQKAGTNLFCRATWGSAFIRLVIVTDASTKVIKGHGESAGVADIAEQDIISLDGALATGADSMVILAKKITDSSLQSADKTFSGAVLSVDTNAQTFTLKDKVFGKVTVATVNATITKGARTISLLDMKAGDKVLNVPGTYDYTTNTLTATSVVVYQDEKVFLPRNFQGTLKSISGTELPITIVVTIGGTDYTVHVPVGSTILKNSKAPALLSRFVVGDTVRFYGVVRPINLTEVDAEVLRDLNF